MQRKIGCVCMYRVISFDGLVVGPGKCVYAECIDQYGGSSYIDNKEDDEEKNGFYCNDVGKFGAT